MLRKFFMVSNIFVIILAAICTGMATKAVFQIIWIFVSSLNGISFGIQWFLEPKKEETGNAA